MEIYVPALKSDYTFKKGLNFPSVLFEILGL